jgi:hypothetical protein
LEFGEEFGVGEWRGGRVGIRREDEAGPHFFGVGGDSTDELSEVARREACADQLPSAEGGEEDTFEDVLTGYKLVVVRLVVEDGPSDDVLLCLRLEGYRSMVEVCDKGGEGRRIEVDDRCYATAIICHERYALVDEF